MLHPQSFTQIAQINWRSSTKSRKDSSIAAGTVIIHASAKLRTVDICSPEPLAAIVPATPVRKPYADGSLGLPYFGKVSLQAAASRIHLFGIPVAIELIEKPASEASADESEEGGGG
jgi:hypothetical protein